MLFVSHAETLAASVASVLERHLGLKAWLSLQLYGQDDRCRVELGLAREIGSSGTGRTSV